MAGVSARWEQPPCPPPPPPCPALATSRTQLPHNASPPAAARRLCRSYVLVDEIFQECTEAEEADLFELRKVRRSGAASCGFVASCFAEGGGHAVAPSLHKTSANQVQQVSACWPSPLALPRPTPPAPPIPSAAAVCCAARLAAGQRRHRDCHARGDGERGGGA